MPSDPIKAALATYAKVFMGPSPSGHVPAMRAAIVAFLRAIEVQPVAKSLGIDSYIGAEMRKAWAGKLADEVERDGAQG